MNSHFRFFVLTRFQNGLKAIDIHKELVVVHGEDSPNLRTVFRWITSIKSGNFQLTKGTSTGRPSSTASTETIQKVSALVTEDSRLTCRLIASELNLPKSVVYRILADNLDLRNVYSVWVPHTLSEENKTQRVWCAKNLVRLFERKGMWFMESNYCIQDETWAMWSPLQKRRVWIPKKAVKPTTVRPKQLTTHKTMLSVAFTCNPKRFSVSVLPAGKTVNADFMIDYLKATQKRFASLKSNKICFKEMLLQMDNARPHSAVLTQDYLRDTGVQIVKQSPYSPDLNLCDRFLFRSLKVELNQQNFSGSEDLVKAVQRYFRGLSENTLCHELQKLYEHCKRVIEVQGDYVSSV